MLYFFHALCYTEIDFFREGSLPMGKTVLITGASGGIGSACARVFAREGWQVALHYGKNHAAAQSLRQELRDMGCDCEAFSADVASPEAVNACVHQVLERYGHLDALVCCAGVAQQKLFSDITDDDWRRMLDIDLGGVFAFNRAVLPAMLARHRGAIVNLSSVWGVCGASCEVHYSAAKAGILGLTRGLAKEVGPSGIRVNCLAPGVIRTEMCACFDDATMAALAGETPLGRIGAPEDVAEAALFLCSEAAAFITGQVLGVDGGFGL